MEHAAKSHDDIINDPAALSKAVKKLKKEGHGLLDAAMAKQQEERDLAAKQKADEKEAADVQRHLNFQISKADVMDVLNHIESSLGSRNT